MATNDNEMSDAQRIKALETIIAKLRKDLERVEEMLRHNPRGTQQKKQKGAVEKVLFMALAEISKLRKKEIRK